MACVLDFHVLLLDTEAGTFELSRLLLTIYHFLIEFRKLLVELAMYFA